MNIYRNWANWNFAILKELCEDEGIEWSEELVAYLKKTPGNTNWSMLVNFGIDPYGCDEGSDIKGEVWFTGVGIVCDNGVTNVTNMTATDKADVESLLSAPNAFDVSVNGTPLTLAASTSTEFMYTDTGSVETFEEVIQGVQNEGQWGVSATVKCSVGNTPVEITVARKQKGNTNDI